MSVRTVLVATAGALALAALPTDAEACSCIVPAVDTSWWWSDASLHVRVLGQKTRAFQNYYIARVVETFEGCDAPGDIVVLSSPIDSAACGMSLTVGSEYLVYGYDTGSIRGFQSYAINSCDYNKEWSTLTSDDTDFLTSRWVTCPDTGIVTCADGTIPFSCFVDPCDFAPPCFDATATCYANYCGGCFYEYWSDFSGLQCSG